MGRVAASFNRGKAKYKTEPRILVSCEDSKSSLLYLRSAVEYYRIQVDVEVVHCGRTDPLGIVRDAHDRRQHYDEIFCVIDRDGHQNFEAALETARVTDKISVIASYPCFEFWLLLHFGYNRKPYKSVGQKSAAERVVEELRTKPGMGNYEKGDAKRLFAALLGRYLTQQSKSLPKY